MKITLAHNVKHHPKESLESEAEWDTPETVAFIKSAIEGLGHTVQLLDVAIDVRGLVNLLEDQKPDLIFNNAEGTSGKYREAFYPAIFEHLALPYTGSDSAALALISNKNHSKRVIEWQFTDLQIDIPDIINIDLVNAMAEARNIIAELWTQHPQEIFIVKPTFDGSSKGITQKSIISNLFEFDQYVPQLVERFPDGLMIEQYLAGTDVSVAWVDTIGVLEPCSYHYQPVGPHAIYEFELKRSGRNEVVAEVPAKISSVARDKLLAHTADLFKVLGVEGFGRADFRVQGDDVWFLEMNALPSLATGPAAEMYMALKLIDKEPAAMFEAIIQAAERKFKL